MRYASFEDGYPPAHLFGSIYTQYLLVEAPNPCRKYHVSCDAASAQAVANCCLPYLREQNLAHKVVEKTEFLSKQSGKFITVYAPPRIHPGSHTIQELDRRLALLRSEGLARATHVPRYRPSGNIFMEAPVGESLMLFGGFRCDPSH